MLGRLNHVAIAVRDIAKAAAVYRDTLGAEVSAAEPQPEHGVTTVFITLPNTKIELLEPLGTDSPIAKFLDRNPDGGIHHVCYEVEDIRAARDALLQARARGCWRRRAQDSAPTASRCCSCIPRTSAAPWSNSNRPEMSVTTALAIYFLIWWIVLFAVLPWGVRSQHEAGEMAPGTDPGAPVIPRLRLKLLWTTVVATAVFGACYVIYVNRLVSLDGLAALLGMP